MIEPKAAPFLPYGRQSLDDDDIRRVVDALKGELLTTGEIVPAFEAAFGRAVGAPHVVACANGTAALHLAMLALGVGPGDVAIVPAITFLASANAARYVGAEVEFADVDPATGLMEAAHLDAALVRAKAKGRPRVVVPVDLNGAVPDLPAMAEVASRHDLRIVEDACHAVGTIADGSPVGSCAHSDLATFSFHPVKTITTGEGGAVTTSDNDIAIRLRRLRNHGMVREPEQFECKDIAFAADGTPNPWHYEMPDIGFNYRITDVQCALGLGQLEKLPQFAAQRRALARRYDERLKPLSNLIRPAAQASKRVQSVLHLYAIQVDWAQLGCDRATLMRKLRERGIGTQVHYIPLYRQPYYAARYGATSLPGAEQYYRGALSLPLFAAMSVADVDRVVDTLEDLVGAQKS